MTSGFYEGTILERISLARFMNTVRTVNRDCFLADISADKSTFTITCANDQIHRRVAVPCSAVFAEDSSQQAVEVGRSLL